MVVRCVADQYVVSGTRICFDLSVELIFFRDSEAFLKKYMNVDADAAKFRSD